MRKNGSDLVEVSVRGMVAALLLTVACGGDGGPPSFSERIPDRSESERHRHCYSCQDKCFREFQRVADTLDDWQADWQKCLTKCSKRFEIDSQICQMRDKEYIIRRKPRKAPKAKSADEE